jgi:hypothetical protein
MEAGFERPGLCENAGDGLHYATSATASLPGVASSGDGPYRDWLGIQVVLVDQEFIGPLRLDIPGRQSVCRKMPHVERNDGLPAADQGGGENMTVFGMVGHRRDDSVVALYPGVRRMNFQLTRQMRRLRRSQTQLGFESAFGFLEDVLRPPREVERTRRLREGSSVSRRPH